MSQYVSVKVEISVDSRFFRKTEPNVRESLLTAKLYHVLMQEFHASDLDAELGVAENLSVDELLDLVKVESIDICGEVVCSTCHGTGEDPERPFKSNLKVYDCPECCKPIPTTDI